MSLEQLPAADHERAVVAIDSWVMRRVLVGANTRGYGKQFVDVLRAAQSAAKSRQSVADAVEDGVLDHLDEAIDQYTGEATGELMAHLYDVLRHYQLRLVPSPICRIFNRRNCRIFGRR